jgi:hypothetical protein
MCLNFFYTWISHIYKKQKFWEELLAYSPWYDTDHAENDASDNSSIERVYSLPP